MTTTIDRAQAGADFERLNLPIGTRIRLTNGREYERYPAGWISPDKLLLVWGDLHDGYAIIEAE